MVDEQKRKPGRPVKQMTDTHKNRIVLMADDEMREWLNWHSAAIGASMSDIIRRAVVAYRESQV